jgi:hypothetical protein
MDDHESGSSYSTRITSLVPLDGGRCNFRFKMIYTVVIIRVQPFKRLMEIKAPEVILRNENVCCKNL